MKWLKENRNEVLYCLILVIVIINQQNDNALVLTRLVSIIGLSIVSLFLNMRFRILNTFLLAASINWISDSAYGINGYDLSYLSLMVALLLNLTMIVNIFLVIRDMYQKKAKGLDRYNGFKLLFIVVAFILLIGSVVSGYAHIYENIWRSHPGAFSISHHDGFPAVYYSSVTYFTVGYGDITPISRIARHVTISQMFFGYMITCLIIPTILVALQKLFQNKSI